MKLSELGEFNLIERLARVVGRPTDEAVLVGIGDDAACWRVEAGPHLITADSLIEGVHFTLGTATWRELGWKALAVNLSDIAAMGGVPRLALVSLGLPADTEVADVEEMYGGMVELARAFGVTIAGGDLSEALVVMINVALVGTAGDEQHILTRDAAVPGECIAVTGNLGASAAGMAVLRQGIELDSDTAVGLREAHLKPNPRVGEGQALARCGVKAAIDISDGLVSDLSRLCEASGVGARIFVPQIPIHPAVTESFGGDAIKLALSGGEDYELLFTAAQDTIDTVKGQMLCPVTVIGEIVEGTGIVLLDRAGNEVDIGSKGWYHFGRRER